MRILVRVAAASGRAGDRSSGAAPAPGEVRGCRSRCRAAPCPRMSCRSRATWQGSGLESRLCFLSLQIVQCFISLEIKLLNIRKCLALTRLERGRGVCFGVVGRVLCFEVIIAKFVAQKKFM